ncbi:MAG: NUDIX hydrolase [Ignavibacteriaceae bacterium]|jgi:8-oxo-dGTP pyrophosphatase MutT (NUDIX family)
MNIDNNGKSQIEFNQSCVIPYRISNGELELLLITSIKKQKWIFPKGYIEFNLSPFESAKKEAYEEAGVIGENETLELGAFELKKKNRSSHIKVFSMEVTKELKDYPEKNLRKRKWFSLSEANETIENVEIKNFISKLKTNIKSFNQNPA